jgi:hypothetical protein
MFRRACLIGTLAVLVVAPSLWAQDDDKDKPKQDTTATPAEQFSALVKEYQTATQEFAKARTAAKTAEERQEAAKLAPKPAEFAPKFFEIAKKNPKDPVAIEALMWVINTGRGSPVSQQAVKMLVADHAGSEKIAGVVQMIGQLPDGEDALRTILAKNKSDQVRGAASYGLARALIVRSFREAEENEAAADKLRAEAGTLIGELLDKSLNARGTAGATLDQALGLIAYAPNGADLLRGAIEKDIPHDAKGKVTHGLAQVVKKQSEEAESLEQALELTKQVEKLLQDVVDNYADVRGPRGTLADAAKTELQEMETFGIGKVAPDIEAEDVDGVTFKLSDYRGKVVFLDFWGHW